MMLCHFLRSNFAIFGKNWATLFQRLVALILSVCSLWHSSFTYFEFYLLPVRVGDVPEGDERGRDPWRLHGRREDVDQERRQRRKNRQHRIGRRNHGNGPFKTHWDRGFSNALCFSYA